MYFLLWNLDWSLYFLNVYFLADQTGIHLRKETDWYFQISIFWTLIWSSIQMTAFLETAVLCGGIGPKNLLSYYNHSRFPSFSPFFFDPDSALDLWMLTFFFLPGPVEAVVCNGVSDSGDMGRECGFYG